jgi:hypothetical protein
MKRTPLRSDPEKTAAWIRRSRKPLPRRGRKTKAWDRARAKLKTVFKAQGVTRCELGFSGCWRGNGLGFAHSLKRRNIRGEQITEVVLACVHCHEVLECLSEGEMARIVGGIIERR